MAIKRIRIIGRRHYYDTELADPYFAPSVTTVLSLIPNRELEEWKRKVGEKKSKKISKKAVNRGSVMHRMIEEYLVNCKIEDAQNLLTSKEFEQYTKNEIKIGKSLFFKLYRLGWMDEIDTVIGSELQMITTLAGGFAGTTDLVAKLKNGKLVIIDFKSSKKPKVNVGKYQLQASAYWMMYIKNFDLIPEFAEIWLMSEELESQRWRFDKNQLKQAGKIYLTWVKKYHNTYGDQIKEFKEEFILNRDERVGDIH